MGKVTLQSIADRLGVSRMTVSNAFSRPDQLSAELRRKILDEAAALGYLGPDPSARSLATGTAGTVGLLWTKLLSTALADEMSARFIGAVADELNQAGLALTLLPAMTEAAAVPARVVAPAGAIIYSCDPQLPAVDLLARRGLPLVYVDADAPAKRPAITIDDYGGAKAAAEYLLALGHRRILVVTTGFGPEPGLVTGPPPADALRQRVLAQRWAGWMDALQAAGITPQVANQPDPYAPHGLDALLAQADRPSAALCLTDVLAQALIAAASDRGLTVPGDLAVVGFDDHPLAERTRPALTTVRQDVDLKGRAAVRALLAELARRADPSAEAPLSQRLRVHLVVRESTAG